MPLFSNGTDTGPSSFSGFESSRFADFHVVSKTIRSLQGVIGLTNRESMIFRYLIANPDKYVDDRQLSTLMFGIFDGESGPAAVRETIRGIRDKYLSAFGVDPIRCDPERGYGVAALSARTRAPASRKPPAR